MLTNIHQINEELFIVWRGKECIAVKMCRGDGEGDGIFGK